jgi:cell filamentation protein
MYEATEDPYCYPGSSVLRNRLGLRTQTELEKFEKLMTTQRADEPLPAGRLSYTHYCAIHRHLFQDIFTWAGRVRTIRLAKEGSMFCYPENIDREMRRLFNELADDNYLRDLDPEPFAARSVKFDVVRPLH